ncbi:hypothetical protein ACF0H5_001417 [Mactra antiquata]
MSSHSLIFLQMNYNYKKHRYTKNNVLYIQSEAICLITMLGGTYLTEQMYRDMIAVNTK